MNTYKTIHVLYSARTVFLHVFPVPPLLLFFKIYQSAFPPPFNIFPFFKFFLFFLIPLFILLSTLCFIPKKNGFCFRHDCKIVPFQSANASCYLKDKIRTKGEATDLRGQDFSFLPMVWFIEEAPQPH